ncbi:TerB family tellurite resistance protein [Algiphilus sp. W345]|uniref:TerB family tellurite resistance protein n=1 Tax=Banduia mediterranea TaxID=3075609 RepID=A0ABU2WI72_9GAMM|nr:TerB family tellurite resistance protein [Algiphilus sp. W345]MDT0497557.1 TerB family tellurite resistance protein [Algiphilus sp. W345]
MLEALSKLFARGDEPNQDPEAKRRMAVAVLLLEIARADFELQETEHKTVRDLVGRHFGLDSAALDMLMERAGRELRSTTSLYGFVETLNRSLSYEDRQGMINMIWQVAFADGRLDPNEEVLVRRLADMLHIPHKDFIREKLRVSGD